MKKKPKWYQVRFRIIFYVIAILIIAGLYARYRIQIALLRLPIGEGPAGPAVSSLPFEEKWTDRDVVFIGLGDSVTRGLGADDKDRYFNLLVNNHDIKYPNMQGKDLSAVLHIKETKNYAVDYSTSGDHLVQAQRISDYPVDVLGIIVMTSGGNDLIHSYGRRPPKDGAMYGCTYEQAVPWCENMKNRIAAVIDEIHMKFPGGCEIFLANIYDPTDGVGDPQLVNFPKWPDAMKVLALANRKIAELCNEYESVHLVDIHSEFLGHGIHCRDFWRKTYRNDDPYFWYYINLEDPNPRGYDAIRRLFLLEMISVFYENSEK